MRKLILWLVLCAAVVSLSSCGASLYDKAIYFNETKQFQQGVEFFTKEFANDQDKAIKYFPVHRYLLTYYKSLGKLDFGLAFYKQFKDQSLRLYIKALSYLLQVDDYKYGPVEASRKALPLLKKAVQLRPHQFMLHYEIGMAYVQLRKMGRAALALSQAVRENSSFAPAAYDLGLLYAYGKGRYGVGKEYIKDALGNFTPSAKSDQIAARFSLAKMYELLGKTGDAISIYEDLQKTHFKKLVWFADLGSLYLKDGDKAKAIDFWKRALVLVGYHSARGRLYFKKMYGARKGVFDITDIGFKFAATDESARRRFYFATEEEFFFMNPSVKSGAYRILRKSGMLDLRKGYEYWVVEYNRVGKRPVPVYKWIQSRGIISKIKLKGKRGRIFISVRKRSSKPPKQRRNANQPTSVKRLWFKSDCRLGFFRGRRHIQTISFPVKHLYKVGLLDLDGDGREEIIASGIDKNNRLVVSTFRLKRGRWRKSNNLTCDIRNKRNGVLFLDLDGKKGLEMVTFTGPISWPNVYTLSRGKYRRNNAIFKDFAISFMSKFGFFNNLFLAKARRARVGKQRLFLYQQYIQHLRIAKQIVR